MSFGRFIRFASAASVSSLLTLGCGDGEPSPERILIDSLADTVWAGEEREAFLATGTGYYFYDDALGTPRRSQYGFSFYDYRWLAEWDVTDEAGEVVNENPEYAIVHPEYILRRYTGGLEERIEAVPGENALVVTIRFDRKREASLRLWEDGRCFFGPRRADLDPSGGLRENPPDHEFPFPLIDPPYGATPSVGFDREASSNALSVGRSVGYPESDRRGEIAMTTLACKREYLLPKSREIRFCYIVGTAKSPASAVAAELSREPKVWRRKRAAETEASLGGFGLYTENSDAGKTSAWARLTLAGMYFKDRGRGMLYHGLPHSPYLDGFYSCYSVIGLGLSDTAWNKPWAIYKTLLDAINRNAGFDAFGGIPSQINRETPTYQKGLTTGAMALHYRRIAAELDSIPDAYLFYIPFALDNAVRMEAKGDRLVSGLLTSPGLFEFIGFPGERRTGAAFETQALFELARKLLREKKGLPKIMIRSPDPVLKGTAQWALPTIAPVAVDEMGYEYGEPLSAEAMMRLYRSRSGYWADRLLLPESNKHPEYNAKMKWPAEADTSQTAAHLLALGWLDGADKKLNARLLAKADSIGLLSHYGIRSLASTDPRFQPKHTYVLDGKPVHTISGGETLVWTAGRLADMYALAGERGQLLTLYSALASYILDAGVVGGLPEALDGITRGDGRDIVRNPLCSASLAEFIRITYDHILGIKSDRKGLPEIKPNIPEEWGEIRFNFRSGRATITVNRDREGNWTASQQGSDDPVRLAVELHPEPDIRAVGSLTLNEGESIRFAAKKSGERLWSVAQLKDDE